MVRKIQVSAELYLAAAAILLILPLKWWFAALLAVLVHEIGHLAAIWLLGGRVMGMKFGAAGAKIEACITGRGKEAFCALSGPLASFLLLLAARFYPEASLCGLIQGCYNLIPIYPMDGGRIIRCILPEDLCVGIEGFALVLLWGTGIWLGLGYHMGVLPLIPGFAATIQLINRKIPCKESKFAVQ